MSKAKIVAVLIGKNESELLSRCLDSIKGVDDIYFVDTGSEDNTVEIAKKYTDKVFTDYKWEKHFAKARNNVLNRVPIDDNTWCLSIDCDEFLHDFSKVREAVDKGEEMGAKVADIYLLSETRGDSKPQIHSFPRLFKRCKEVWWEGAAHNHISRKPDFHSDVKITYGWSPAHSLDPNRTLEILKEDVAKNGGPRETYYLAREYWYRGMYKDCVKHCLDYIEKSQFLSEKADAYLMLARCYFFMGMGNEAREACVQAIVINANFKEAINFMATLAGKGSGNPVWEKNATQWENMAKTADNSNVLFIRE